MSDPAHPYVVTRGALPLTASRVLVEGDFLTDADIVLIGGAAEVERLALMGLLERRALLVVSSPSKAGKADKARIADLEGQLAAVVSGTGLGVLEATVARLTSERDAAVAAAAAAEADDQIDAAATAEAIIRAAAAETALASLTAELEAAQAARAEAETLAAAALAARTAERDRAEADLQAANRRIQVLDSRLAAVPDPAIAAQTVLDLNTRITALTAERDAALAGAADPAVHAALTERLARAESALEAANLARDTALADLAAAPSAAVIENLTAERDAARADAASLRTELALTQDALASARKDAVDAAAAGMAALNQVAALGAQVADQTLAAARLQAELDAARAGVAAEPAPTEDSAPGS